MHYYVVRCTESILHMLINIYFITKKSFYTFNSLDNKVVQHILRSQAVLLLCSLSPPLKMQVCLFFLHQYPLYQSRKVPLSFLYNLSTPITTTVCHVYNIIFYLDKCSILHIYYVQTYLCSILHIVIRRIYHG